ncbi:MAG: SIS domain-containing protein [Rhodobacterales bacterium]|nr:SIS domain-containing protein [Rhodobacterales bacterium]
MTALGALMAAEIAQAPGVFARAAAADHTAALAPLALGDRRAVYTVARGSSDAAANILSYEIMRETGLPVTSLPPSVFSLGAGVALDGAAVLVISQSGASEDLVRSATGARARGAAVVAITNAPGSAVEAAADVTLPIGAGPELAVPATKSVIGSIAAGMALLGAMVPAYAPRARASAAVIGALGDVAHPQAGALVSALLRAQHVYVIGRDTGYGAAQEVALKIKETCAIHAEAYSSSEVLHGPLQLVTKPLLILILDTGMPLVQDSLDTAEARFRAAGGAVQRLRPADVGAEGLTPAAAAALLLTLVYPVILAVAVALGHDPDRPATLSKVTQTT